MGPLFFVIFPILAVFPSFVFSQSIKSDLSHFLFSKLSRNECLVSQGVSNRNPYESSSCNPALPPPSLAIQSLASAISKREKLSEPHFFQEAASLKLQSLQCKKDELEFILKDEKSKKQTEDLLAQQLGVARHAYNQIKAFKKEKQEFYSKNGPLLQLIDNSKPKELEKIDKTLISERTRLIEKEKELYLRLSVSLEMPPFGGSASGRKAVYESLLASETHSPTTIMNRVLELTNQEQELYLQQTTAWQEYVSASLSADKKSKMIFREKQMADFKNKKANEIRQSQFEFNLVNEDLKRELFHRDAYWEEIVTNSEDKKTNADLFCELSGRYGRGRENFEEYLEKGYLVGSFLLPAGAVIGTALKGASRGTQLLSGLLAITPTAASDSVKFLKKECLAHLEESGRNKEPWCGNPKTANYELSVQFKESNCFQNTLLATAGLATGLSVSKLIPEKNLPPINSSKNETVIGTKGLTTPKTRDLTDKHTMFFVQPANGSTKGPQRIYAEVQPPLEGDSIEFIRLSILKDGETVPEIIRMNRLEYEKLNPKPSAFAASRFDQVSGTDVQYGLPARANAAPPATYTPGSVAADGVPTPPKYEIIKTKAPKGSGGLLVGNGKKTTKGEVVIGKVKFNKNDSYDVSWGGRTYSGSKFVKSDGKTITLELYQDGVLQETREFFKVNINGKDMGTNSIKIINTSEKSKNKSSFGP